MHGEVVHSNVIAAHAAALIDLVEIHHAHSRVLVVDGFTTLACDVFWFIVLLIEIELRRVTRLRETEERMLLNPGTNRQDLYGERSQRALGVILIVNNGDKE